MPCVRLEKGRRSGPARRVSPPLPAGLHGRLRPPALRAAEIRVEPEQAVEAGELLARID